MDVNNNARGPAPSRQGSRGTHHGGSSRNGNRHDATETNGHANNHGGGGGGGGGGNGHSNHHGGGGSGSSKVKPPSKNLFVAGLDPDAGDQDLDRAFHPFGPIVSCKVMVDLHTGLSRRFGFVLFEDEHSAVQAKSALQGKPLPGRELETLAANPAPPSSSSPSKANADDSNSPPGKKTDASETKSGSAAPAADAAAQSEGGQQGQPQQGRGIIVEFSTVHPTHHLQSRERGLYVRNIPRGVPRYLLEQHFGAFGHVEALEVLRDTAKGATSRNVVAKVSYGSADEAERAIKHTHRAVNFFAKFAVGIVNGNCAVATGAAAAAAGAGGADAAVSSSSETTTAQAATTAVGDLRADASKPAHDEGHGHEGHGRGSPGHCAGCGITNHPAPRTTHNEMLAVAAAAIAAVSPSSRPTSPLDPGSAAAPTINATAAATASTTDPSSEAPQATSTTATTVMASASALPPPALVPALAPAASAMSNLNLCELYRAVRATASDALTHYLPIEHMRAPECFSVCGRCDVAYRAQLSTIPPLLAKFAEPQQQRMERLAHVQSEKKKSDDPQASDATALAAGTHGQVQDGTAAAPVGRDQSGSLQRVSSRPGLGAAPLSPTNGQSQQGHQGHQGQQVQQQGRPKESSNGRDFTMSASAAPFAVPQGFTVTGDASASSAPPHHGYAAPIMPVSVGAPFVAPPSGYQHPSQAPYPHQAQPGATNSQPVGVAGTGGSLSQTGDSFGAGGGGVGGSLGQSATVPIVAGHGQHHVGGQHAYPVPYAAVGASVGTSLGHMSVGSHVGVGASYGSSIPAYSAVPPPGFHAPGSPAGYHPQGGAPAVPTAHGHMVAGGYYSSGSPMGSFVYNNNSSGVSGGHQSHGGRGSENTSMVQPLSSGAASTGGSFAAHPTAALQSPKKTDEAAKLASGDEAATKATSVSASAPGFIEADGSKAAPVATTAQNRGDAPYHHHAASVGNSAGSVGGSFGAVGASVSAAGTANVFGGVDLGAATSLFDDTTTSSAAPVDYSPGKASEHSSGGAHHHSGGGAAAPAKLPFVASAKPTAATTGADMSTTDPTATNPGGANPWAPAPHRLLSPAGVKLATPGTAVTMSVVAAGIDDDLATPSGAKLTQNPPNPNSTNATSDQKLNESAGVDEKAHHVDPAHSVGSASAPHATASNSNATPVSLEGNTSGKGSSRATASSTTERPSMPSGGALGAAVSAARSAGSRDAASSVVSSEVPRMADGRVDTKAHLRGDFPDDVVPPSHQAAPPVADQSPRECGHPTACPSDVIPSMHVGDSTNGNVNGNQQQSSHVFLFPSPSAAHGGDASAAVFGSRAASEEPQVLAAGTNSGAAVGSSNNKATAGAHHGASVEVSNGATASAVKVEVEAASPPGGEKPGAAETAGPASAAVSATGPTGATATAPVAAPSPLLCPSTTGHSAGSTGGSLGQAMLFPFGAPAHVAANAGFVHPPPQHAAFVGGGQPPPAGTATHQHQGGAPAQQAAQAAAAVPPYVTPMVIPQQSSGAVVGAPDAASSGSGAAAGPETPTPPAGYQYVPVLMAVPVGTSAAAAATAAAAHGYHPHAFYGHLPHHAHAPVPAQDGAATVPVHVGMTPACVGPPSTGHSAGSQGKPFACSPTGPAPPSRSFGTPPPPPSWA